MRSLTEVRLPSPPPHPPLRISAWKQYQMIGFYLLSIVQQSFSMVFASFLRFWHVLSISTHEVNDPSSSPWPFPLRISKLSPSIEFQFFPLVQQSFSIILPSFSRFGYLLPRQKFVFPVLLLLGISVSRWPQLIRFQLS